MRKQHMGGESLKNDYAPGRRKPLRVKTGVQA